MEFQKIIRILGTATEGRYIGGVHDKSAPTDVRMSLLTWISDRRQGRSGLVLSSLLCYLLLHQLHRVLIGHPFNTERSQAVTLTEVKDALFRDYLQGDNRSYSSTCQFYISLSLLIVTAWSVWNYHRVAFPPTVWLDGGRVKRPPLFSPWHFTKQQVVSGVSLTLLRWSPTPHSSQVSRDCLEKPSMKSKTWIK